MHGRPIIFGPNQEQCVVRAGDGSLQIAAVADVGCEAIVVHDAHRHDPSLAFALSRLGDLSRGPVPIGVLRSVPTGWGEGLVAENRRAHAAAGDAELDALLTAGDTWSVA